LFTATSYATFFQNCCKMWICILGFIYSSCMIRFSTTLSSCSSGIPEQSVSRTMGRTRWTNSMAYWFIYFFLYFGVGSFSVRVSAYFSFILYDLQYWYLTAISYIFILCNSGNDVYKCFHMFLILCAGFSSRMAYLSRNT
jgi:hypothetical protein